MNLTGEKIYKALEYLKPLVHRTPLITSETTNKTVNKKVYFKMENQQKTGAFKFRGATFKLMQLSNEQLGRGVITASAGNHAQGIAYASRKFGVKAIIYMPESTPHAKIKATQNYGAEVVLYGHSFQEAFEASMIRQAETGTTYVHPFDDYDIMAGQGTIALEVLKQEERIDTLIVPIGGGGLISGIAVAAKHINKNIRIIGVQASNVSATYNKFHHIETPETTQKCTIAEGIAVKHPGELTMPIINQYVDDIVTVTEKEIAEAVLFMLERNKSLIEGAGAAALAALFTHNDKIQSHHCGVILSGGNIDIDMIPHIKKLVSNKKSTETL